MQRTTIALAPVVRDRLQNYGSKGMTYEHVLVRLMDAITPEEVEARAFRPPYVHPASEGRLRALRQTTPEQKLIQADDLRRMAAKVNPIGYRSLIKSRRRHRKSESSA